MKLLIISDAWHPQINGVVRTYEHLTKGLQKLGHTVQIIGPADFPRAMSMPGYGEIKLAILPYNRLKHMIDASAPDAIHIATEGPLGLAARRYCLRHNHPFTTAYHTQFPDYVAKRVARYLTFLYKPAHALAKAFIRNFHAKSNGMMVATQSLEDELKSWNFKTPMHRVTRGVNLDEFHPGERTLFTDLKRPVALHVGRIAIEKNIEDFLDMDWHGSKVIIGDGPARAQLETKYPDAIFLGKKTGADLAQHYRSVDIFVFPSRTDTFGIVLIEALASGLPVAAYNVTGPKDVITKDELGSLHETDLSTAAQQALTSGTPAQRAQHVNDHHTWDFATHQFESTIKASLKA